MRPLGWLGVVRLGLVQAALGGIVVMSTTVMNRIMAVELALPALIPGALIAVHHGAELLRPRWGHGSDAGGRRTPWIVGGMACLALGGIGAPVATLMMGHAVVAGLALATVSYLAIGIGAGAAGTALLTLAATRVAPERRAIAASVIWIMMILGFAVTAGVAGRLLDPFSPGRLVGVAAGVSGVALVVAVVAIAGVEGAGPAAAARRAAPVPFREAFAAVWSEPAARRFTLFITVAMLAYGAQDLLIDPFAGRILGLSPGASTSLTGLQHGAAVLGMAAVAILGGTAGRRRPGLARSCASAGCGLSAAALVTLALGGAIGPAFPLRAVVAILGFGNGAFAVAAIGAMMGVAGSGTARREGLRMGLFGAAQAFAFAAGSLAGPAVVQIVAALAGSTVAAYGSALALDAALFLAAARLVVAATAPNAEAAASGGAVADPILVNARA